MARLGFSMSRHAVSDAGQGWRGLRPLVRTEWLPTLDTKKGGGAAETTPPLQSGSLRNGSGSNR